LPIEDRVGEVLEPAALREALLAGWQQIKEIRPPRNALTDAEDTFLPNKAHADSVHSEAV